MHLNMLDQRHNDAMELTAGTQQLVELPGYAVCPLNIGIYFISFILFYLKKISEELERLRWLLRNKLDLSTSVCGSDVFRIGEGTSKQADKRINDTPPFITFDFCSQPLSIKICSNVYPPHPPPPIPHLRVSWRVCGWTFYSIFSLQWLSGQLYRTDEVCCIMSQSDPTEPRRRTRM